MLHLSDHKAVIATLDLKVGNSGSPHLRKSGIWKLNAEILRDPDFGINFENAATMRAFKYKSYLGRFQEKKHSL